MFWVWKQDGIPLNKTDLAEKGNHSRCDTIFGEAFGLYRGVVVDKYRISSQTLELLQQ